LCCFFSFAVSACAVGSCAVGACPCPVCEDWAKLTRVLKYLKETEHLGLILRNGDKMVINAYINASFGVHEMDRRSQTGACIGIGDALRIMTNSTKQKIVTKSSTEAELVAVTDMVGDVVDLKGFVAEMGYEDIQVITFQDNQSTMHLMSGGGPPPSSKSKHIRIRTFWIREISQEHDIEFNYKPTEEMVTDGFTKPLQGEPFVVFTDNILGYQNERVDGSRGVLEI